MKYAYENLSSQQFEQFVILLCQKLLGIAVQSFSSGPDGGRDAGFNGTCEIFPSKAEPWTGITIIQAKHTNGFNKHFSEGDFYSKKGSSGILNKEIARIKKLRRASQLDNYILFANRRLSANSESEIRAYIAEECKIPEFSVRLCGIEDLETWLKEFPDISKKANLDPLDSPLIVSPDDLSEVVEALAKQQPLLDSIDNPPISRISYKEKNKINNMSEEYGKTLRKRYLKETMQIYGFLSDPGNLELLKLYQNTIEEFQFKIIAKRKDYQNFDSIINYLFDLLFARDPVLNRHKRLTRAMLFYMYWNCDIGKTEDA